MIVQNDIMTPPPWWLRPAVWARILLALTLVLIAENLLLGWVLGLDLFTRVLPGLPAMVPGTALGAGGLAVGQVLLNEGRRKVGLSVLGVTAALAGLVFVTGIQTYPGGDRMSVATIAGLLLVALAQVSAEVPKLARRGIHALIAGLGAYLALLGVSGYVTGAAALEDVAFFNGHSILTALVLTCLNLSVVLVRPDGTWIATLFSRHPGGRMARRTLPWAVLLPAAFCAIAYVSTQTGQNTDSLRFSALAVALMTVTGVAVLYSARYQNEIARRDRNELDRTRDILSGLDVSIFVLDMGGHPVMANEKAQALAGRDVRAEDWIAAAPFHALADRRPLTQAERPLPRLLAGEDDVFAGWVDDVGAEHILRFTLVQAERRNGSPGRLILAIYDVTEPWQLRENLARGERFDAIGQMAGGVAHEMANIFGVILLALDAAQLRGTISDPKAFEAVAKATGRGGALADRMLALTRDSVWMGGVIDARETVRGAVELTRSALSPDITLDWQPPDGEIPVACDPVDLEMAVVNLVLNARNAIEGTFTPSGRISVALRDDRTTFRLCVTDDGPGMSDATLRRAVEPFFTTRRESGGTGLGLSIIESFARRIGGRFELDSTPGQGTTATLVLPVATEGDVTPVADPDSAASLDGLSILMVEDDEQFRDMLADTLIVLGAQVARAADIGEAMEHLASTQPFDIMLTDINLPGGSNGRDLAVQAVALRPDLRVVYLSGYIDANVAWDAPVPGLLLRKPVQIAPLTHTLLLAMQTQPRSNGTGEPQAGSGNS